jgi:hypothetical protein
MLLLTTFFGLFADLATHKLTLVTTRYIIGVVKRAIKGSGGMLEDSDRTAVDTSIEVPHIPPNVAWVEINVRQGQWPAYLTAGMELIRHSYKHLVAKIDAMGGGPVVILLYNPTPHEIYRNIWVESDSKADQTSSFLLEALRLFAHSHGWQFLDLTPPLRQQVRTRQEWLYGHYDRTHWSQKGSELVAAVLAAKLRKIIDT